VHPILLRIGPFHLGTLTIPAFNVACYGPLIALGVLVGVFFAVRRAKTVGLSPDFILDLTFYGVIIGFVGSRVFFILNELRGFVESPWEYIFSRQGYVFFGGLMSTLVFAIWYVRRKRVEPWQVADVMAPSIAIAHMFGRIGCFFSGCCYGRLCPTGWEKWGVSFPLLMDPATGKPSMAFNFAYWDQLEHFPSKFTGVVTGSLPIFPVQLDEAAANLLIFLGLLWLWRRRRFRGQIFAAYLAAYGTVRFLVEFLRGDYGEPTFFGLLQRGQMSQILCLTAVAAGVAIWWLRRATPLEAPAANLQPTAGPSADHDSPADAPKTKNHRHRHRNNR